MLSLLSFTETNFVAIGRIPTECILIHKEGVAYLKEFGFKAKIKCIAIDFEEKRVSRPVIIDALQKYYYIIPRSFSTKLELFLFLKCHLNRTRVLNITGFYSHRAAGRMPRIVPFVGGDYLHWPVQAF